jgi:hypothetical protein
VNEELATLANIEKKRRIYLIGIILSFSAWMIGWIMTYHFETVLPHLIYKIFSAMLILGAIGWAGLSLYLLKINALVKSNPSFCKYLNDERTKILRLKAMSYGFVASITIGCLFFAAGFINDAFFTIDANYFTAGFAGHTMMYITLLSSWIAYYILDEQEPDENELDEEV